MKSSLLKNISLCVFLSLVCSTPVSLEASVTNTELRGINARLSSMGEGAVTPAEEGTLPVLMRANGASYVKVASAIMRQRQAVAAAEQRKADQDALKGERDAADGRRKALEAALNEAQDKRGQAEEFGIRQHEMAEKQKKIVSEFSERSRQTSAYIQELEAQVDELKKNKCGGHTCSKKEYDRAIHDVLEKISRQIKEAEILWEIETKKMRENEPESDAYKKAELLNGRQLIKIVELKRLQRQLVPLNTPAAHPSGTLED